VDKYADPTQNINKVIESVNYTGRSQQKKIAISTAKLRVFLNASLYPWIRENGSGKTVTAEVIAVFIRLYFSNINGL